MALRVIATVVGGTLLGLGIGLTAAAPGAGILVGIGAGLLIAAALGRGDQGRASAESSDEAR